MCKYCNKNLNECCIHEDPLTHDWYLNVETSEWDGYEDEYVHQKVYISYCPYCGRKLGNEEKVDSELDYMSYKEVALNDEEAIDYLKSTGLYNKDKKFYFEKQMLKTEKCISIKKLAKRFIEIDKCYNGEQWNIRQILSNIEFV